MLLIFDLDDTLIQTTATFTPHQLKRAIHKMVQHGLQLKDVEAATAEIQRLDQTTSSAKETLTQFLDRHGQREPFFEIGLKEAYENFSFHDPILPSEGANELLSTLKENHLLALVSAGVKEQQIAKMEKAGIDTAFFSKIAICQREQKGSFYQAFAQELSVDPSSVLVCGDRVGVDLVPAKALGFWTVQMRQGRGTSSCDMQGVDFTIKRLEELLAIIPKLEVEPLEAK